MVQERKGEAVKPVQLLRLMDEWGPTKVSKRLGVSTTTLYKARKANVVSKSIEIAAGALAQGVSAAAQPSVVAQPTVPHVAATGETVLLIMEVPKSKAELLKRVALQFGAETVET